MKPLVSVIIPAYNCAAYVAQTLDSVLSQHYPAKEVIVVNDGSVDGTLDILHTFGDRIRVIDQKNAGPPAARNAGLAAARGAYIAFVDADDIWLQGKLTAQANHLDENQDVAAVFTHWHVWAPAVDGIFVRPVEISSRGVSGKVDQEHSGWLYPRLLLDCELLTSTVMLRTSIVERIGGFDVDLFNGDDYDYWLRVSREGRITKLASTGVLYRILPTSVSRTPRVRNFEHEVVTRAVARWGIAGPDDTRADPAAIERRLDSLELAHAYAHLYQGDPRIALNIYLRGLARHPANFKLWINAARTAVKTWQRMLRISLL